MALSIRRGAVASRPAGQRPSLAAGKPSIEKPLSEGALT